MHPVQIGTCGWSYADWSGVFYPADLKATDYLAHYASHYPVVEVDSTYYRAPSPSTVATWREKTPDGFGFSLKVPQTITHEKVLVDCAQERDGFLAAARLLGDKLRCCVLQFGYLNKTSMPSPKAFLERLDAFLADWPDAVPVAVEVRNKSWMTAKLAECLRAHQAIWVLPDQAWMPTPLSLVEKLDAVTGPFAYFRLLGDRDEVDKRTATLDRVVIDRTQQIEEDAQAILRLSERVPVLAFVNNHFAGHAPATIQDLQAALRKGAATPW